MNVIKIALCDDEEYILKMLKKMFERYIINLESNLNIQIETFKDASSLLNNIEKVDILFLDVELPEVDGFRVAKKIRALGLETKIIFLTSHKEYIQDAFKVKAFRYLYKPVTEAVIIEVMDEVMKEIEENEVITVKKAHVQFYIKVQDIYYIEALGDGAAIHTENQIFVVHQSLLHWQERFQRKFYRCHRSYLVHFLYVSELQDSKIILKNEISVPVAIRKKSEIKRKYQEYVMEYSKII